MTEEQKPSGDEGANLEGDPKPKGKDKQANPEVKLPTTPVVPPTVDAPIDPTAIEASALQALYTKLGIPDEATLIQIVKERHDAEEAAKTAEQRLQEKITAHEATIAELKDSLKKSEEARMRDRRVNALLQAAAAAGAPYPEDVVGWAESSDGTNFAAILDKDGAVVKDKVTAIITAAKTARPNYFTAKGHISPGAPAAGSSRPQGADVQERNRSLNEMRQQARRRF